MEQKQKLIKCIHLVCVIVFVLSLAGGIIYTGYSVYQTKRTRSIQQELSNIKEAASGIHGAKNGASLVEENRTQTQTTADILEKYRELYERNPDMVGWLTIPGTVIDYPVMQTMWDETHYLTIDFYGQPNQNGCLILDTDSMAGTGTAALQYADGEPPSTNLIIHGHNMRSGEMFGSLLKYRDEAYGQEHSIICFDSLYEEREYELIAVFYSQVYYQEEEVFKYYNFFQADSQEEFDDWYTNIMAMSLYDTGVTAKFGDEFITLSTCAYHIEDGRFVVVGKRIDNP